MTEPLNPAPPIPEPPRKRHVWRWVAAGVAVVLLLTVAITAFMGRQIGDSKAADYREAAATWDQRNGGVRDAVASVSVGLWDESIETTMEAACDRVDEVRGQIKKSMKELPIAAGGFLEKLSSSLEKAVDGSAARLKDAEAYAKVADESLAQIRKDCLWNIRQTAADSGSAKIWRKSEKLTFKAGTSFGAYYCPAGGEDCLPVTAAGRDELADLITKATDMDRQYYTKLFAPGSCGETSLGDVCAVVQSSLAGTWGDTDKYAEAVRSNGAVNSVVDESAKNLKQRLKKIENAILAEFPEFEKEIQLTEELQGPSVYFDAYTRQALDELEKLGERMPGGTSADDEQHLAMG